VTARKSFDAILDTRRDAREDRDYVTYQRLAKREGEAEDQIGELTRDGRTVFYVWPTGGKYREGSRSELVSFLIRNQYA
jgi:dipeptidyl aminopeptidase/acylaminoacyl peptidase